MLKVDDTLLVGLHPFQLQTLFLIAFISSCSAIFGMCAEKGSKCLTSDELGASILVIRLYIPLAFCWDILRVRGANTI